MPLKDFAPKSYRPVLVDYYISATVRCTKHHVWISEKCYPKFKILEDDLREYGIPPKDYAYTVYPILLPVARKAGLKVVPVNMFCGNWALKAYKKIDTQPTVHIDADPDDNIQVIQSELMVARLYIERNLHTDGVVRLMDVVDELRPLLSPKWLDLYDNGGIRPIVVIVDQLSEEYNIRKSVISYADIVDCLR